MWLLDLLNPIKPITDALVRAYEAHANAGNQTDRIKAEVTIAELEARRDVVIAASANDRWWSPRTLMGWSAALYVAKIVVWDTVLGWGVTPNPGEQVTYIVMTIVAFYFVSQGVERLARSLSNK